MMDYTKLLKKITPARDGEPLTHLRVGVANTINSDGTVDVVLSGVVIPSVPRLAGAVVQEGQSIQMIGSRGSLLILGGTATGGASPVRRIGTSIMVTDSATFTTTAVQVASITVPLVSGSVYRVTFDGSFDTTVTGDIVRARIFENSTAGTQLQARDTGSMNAAGLVTALHMEVEFPAVTTGNKTFVVTGERDAGSGDIVRTADATFPAYMYVDHVRES